MKMTPINVSFLLNDLNDMLYYASVAAAEELRDKVIAAVRNGDFIAVCNGMTADDIPAGGVEDDEIGRYGCGIA